MKEIPLTQGKFAMVDDADYEAVMQFKWYAAKIKSGIWYAQRKIQKLDGTQITQTLHRFLMPGVKMVDHKDGNSLNDQRDNLRPCNSSQNAMNRKPLKGGTSKSKGVSWHACDKKWYARITFEGKKYHLGYFVSEEDAARAYDAAALKYHGEFARLNFPLTKNAA